MKKLMERIAHLGMGGMLGAMMTIISMLQEELAINTMMLMPFVGTICVTVLSAIKSLVVDEEFDIWNLLLPVIGSCLIHLTVIVALLSR